jgi:type VI secretion system protein
MLLGNFAQGLDRQWVSEQDQHVLSVLDNLQRILNSRQGALSHLPDFGLPDMSTVLQGLPVTAQRLMATMASMLLRYEPRLASLEVELLPQRQPGQLDYALHVVLKQGTATIFATTLNADGRALVRHLKGAYALRGPRG